MDEIIEPDANVEAMCMERFEETNKKRTQGTYEYFSGNPLNIFANLYRADKIIDKNRFMAIVAESDDESVKWIVDVEHYDYKRFDLKWLTYCYDVFLNELGSSENVSKKIIDKFYEDYSEGKLEKNVVDKVIRYFLMNNR